MRRKHKALVLILLLFFISAATIGGCSTSLDPNADSHTVTAEDGGQEEVLDQDADDGSQPPEGSSKQGAAAGFFLSLGYVAMTIGSAVLPLLMLM